MHPKNPENKLAEDRQNPVPELSETEHSSPLERSHAHANLMEDSNTQLVPDLNTVSDQVLSTQIAAVPAPGEGQPVESGPEVDHSEADHSNDSLTKRSLVDHKATGLAQVSTESDVNQVCETVSEVPDGQVQKQADSSFLDNGPLDAVGTVQKVNTASDLEPSDKSETSGRDLPDGNKDLVDASTTIQQVLDTSGDYATATNRRTVLIAGTALAVNLFPLFTSGWKGSTAKILCREDVVETGIMLATVKTFRNASGIHIQVDPFRYANIHNRLIENAKKAVSEYDVVWVDDIWITEMAIRGVLVPLTEQARSDIPEINTIHGSQVRSAEAWVDRWGGKAEECGFSSTVGKDCTLWTIPQSADVQVLFCNTEIFSDPGVQKSYRTKTGQNLAIPQTWEEYARVATGLSGVRFRDAMITGCCETLGRDHWAFDSFAPRFWSMLQSTTGSEPEFYATRKGRYVPVFNGDAGLHAIRHFRSLRPYWAPRSEDASHSESIQYFSRGTTAMCPQWSRFHNVLSQSLSGRWAMTLLPGTGDSNGVIRRTPCIGGGGLAIPVNAPDRKKSWAVIRWLTSEQYADAAAIKGAMVARATTYLNPEVRSRYSWIDIYLESIAQSVVRPRLEKFVEFESIVGRAVNQAVIERNEAAARKELDRAAADATPLLENLRSY